MDFPKEYFVYAVIAVVIGLVFSFGYVGMNRHPLPLQVPLDTYAPTVAPPPAIPTQAPQLVKDNTVRTGEFDPAPPPVVVTTAPLPTITPVATDVTPEKYSICSTQSNMIETIKTGSMYAGILMIVLGMTVIMSSLMSIVSPNGGRGGGGFGVASVTSAIMLIIAGGTFLLLSNVILQALASAQSGILCPP